MSKSITIVCEFMWHRRTVVPLFWFVLKLYLLSWWRMNHLMNNKEFSALLNWIFSPYLLHFLDENMLCTYCTWESKEASFRQSNSIRTTPILGTNLTFLFYFRECLLLYNLCSKHTNTKIKVTLPNWTYVLFFQCTERYPSLVDNARTQSFGYMQWHFVNLWQNVILTWQLNEHILQN